MAGLLTALHINHWVSYLTYSPYATVFLLLTAGICFIPLAEEWALMTAGYLYYSDQVQLVTILIVVGLGVFFGDFVAFWPGRHWIKTRPHSPFPLLGRSK